MVFPFTTLLRVKKSRIVCRTIRYGVPSAVSDISHRSQYYLTVRVHSRPYLCLS